MSVALLSPGASERWLSGDPRIRRFSTTTGLFVLASLVLHLAIVGSVVVTGWPPQIAPRQEIAVEVVQEVPKPPELPKAARAEPPKPAPAPTKQAERAVRPPPPPPPAAKADEREQKLAALESELETLKAEHTALSAARAAAAIAKPQNAGLGPLPDSFQAVALPDTAEGAGDAVGYQEIVFSALAKAKGIGRTKGLPGSAGVHFEIDAAGRLVSMEIVHPSGVPSLDDEALAIVRKAAPFPPPPQGAQRSFDANVSFVAERGE